MLDQQARGCPRCALNFEAEHLIDRFIWRRLLPSLVLITLVVVAVVYMLR